MPPELRFCKSCSKYKPLERFSFTAPYKDRVYRRHSCKDCEKLKRKKRDYKYSEKINAYQRKWRKSKKGKKYYREYGAAAFLGLKMDEQAYGQFKKRVHEWKRRNPEKVKLYNKRYKAKLKLAKQQGFNQC